MRHGQIVEQGLVNEVYANPQHPYTRGLLACRPRLGAKRARLPTVDDYMSQAAAPVDTTTK
jgi:peptide/nickel transport system ATP-binding protein